LIGKPTIQRNLTQGRIGGEHKSLCAFHTAPDNVLVRRLAEAVTERTPEVRWIQSCDRRQIFVPDRPIQVRFDMRSDFANLPRSQATAAFFPDGRFLLTKHLQHFGCAAQTVLRCTALVVERTANRSA
jgi:hypothetical protein